MGSRRQAPGGNPRNLHQCLPGHWVLCPLPLSWAPGEHLKCQVLTTDSGYAMPSREMPQAGVFQVPNGDIKLGIVATAEVLKILLCSCPCLVSKNYHQIHFSQSSWGSIVIQVELGQVLVLKFNPWGGMLSLSNVHMNLIVMSE